MLWVSLIIHVVYALTDCDVVGRTTGNRENGLLLPSAQGLFLVSLL
jgi:hypothetical protein